MQGKIIKGIAGFYYVHANGVVYECKAKGVFRNRKIKPLVGAYKTSICEYRPGNDYICSCKSTA